MDQQTIYYFHGAFLQILVSPVNRIPSLERDDGFPSAFLEFRSGLSRRQIVVRKASDVFVIDIVDSSSHTPVAGFI